MLISTKNQQNFGIFPNSHLCLSVNFPRVQTWSRLPGTVWRGLIFFTTDRPHSSNAPAFGGQSRLSGFCCANRLCVRSPCHHNSRMRTFDENSCAISITSPSSFVPGPNKFGGITGRSPGERPHYGIAGESPGKRDLM